LSVGIFTTLAALVLYAYLGIFSRYSSDDYCLSAFFLQDNLLGAIVRRYFVSTSRYTNVLFIGLADQLFGWYSVAVLPALMLALFVLGLYLILKEISEMFRLGWSRWMSLFLSLFIVYFSVSQAPDLYETLYWRAGMTSHFAPLVFIPFLGAFLLRQIRKANEHFPSFWTQAACFLIPFLIGGLSEPPTTLMITFLFLAFCAVWCWSDIRYRRARVVIVFWSFLGAVIALIVMAVAPANSLRMQTPPPGLLILISRVINYPFYFIIDTLRSLPLPTLMSVAVPALLFYVKYTYPAASLSKGARTRLGLVMLVILVLGYFLIAASFAPSAYGQSYPVPRARFIGRLLMTITLMTEGALLGILVAQIRLAVQWISPRSVAVFTMLVLALYPLRTTWRASAEIPVYRQRAAAWDARDADIRALKQQGVQDVVIRFLPDVPIQDLGDRTGFRLNRCAAALYGVNSIVAVPMEGE
ncbi:MAG TPA: hypothetical protein VGK56_18120, partial [Anaerolineales bacterium]